MNQKNKSVLVALVLVAIAGTMFFLYWDFGPPEAGAGFSMFQALRVVYTDNTDSWKYPSSRTTLTPMKITDTYNSKEVLKVQSYVYFTLVSNASSKKAKTVNFYATGSVAIYSWGKTLVKPLGSMPITQTVSSPENATETYLISATMTAADLQNSINAVDDDYYLVFSLGDIRAVVTFVDGTTTTYTLTGVQAEENQLWWKFTLQNESGELQITSLSVEWMWK